MSRRYFVTGINTEVGKTVVSSVLVAALGADYWKPVQAGDLHDTDSMKVSRWTKGRSGMVHPEAFRLKEPMSPHASAAREGVSIRMEDFELPETTNHLIVEGAGGLMVPLNERDLMTDLIRQLKLPVILVVRNYLGSINHSLLSILAIRALEIPMAGWVVSGKGNRESEDVIERYLGEAPLFRIPEMDVSTASILHYAEDVQRKIKWL